MDGKTREELAAWARNHSRGNNPILQAFQVQELIEENHRLRDEIFSLNLKLSKKRLKTGARKRE